MKLEKLVARKKQWGRSNEGTND